MEAFNHENLLIKELGVLGDYLDRRELQSAISYITGSMMNNMMEYSRLETEGDLDRSEISCRRAINILSDGCNLVKKSKQSVF